MLESVARTRNYTRSTPVLPSSLRSITVTRFKKVYFNWFNVRYPGREANGKLSRSRGRIKTFRSHLSLPDVYYYSLYSIAVLNFLRGPRSILRIFYYRADDFNKGSRETEIRDRGGKFHNASRCDN